MEETSPAELSAPLWVMWGGLAVGFVGFLAAWTDRSFGLLQVLNQDLFEATGRWLMRVGFAAAAIGAAAHLLTS